MSLQLYDGLGRLTMMWGSRVTVVPGWYLPLGVAYSCSSLDVQYRSAGDLVILARVMLD